MSHLQTPWTDILAANWQNAPRAIVLTDMSRCLPNSALSSRMERGRWRIAEYEAGGLHGRMILACPDSGAAAVSLPLTVDGPHAVFVGLYSTRTCPSAAGPTTSRTPTCSAHRSTMRTRSGGRLAGMALPWRA